MERLEVTDPLRSEQNNGNGKKLQLCEQNQDCFARHSVRSEQDEDGGRRCCETLDVHRKLYKNSGVEKPLVKCNAPEGLYIVVSIYDWYYGQFSEYSGY